MLMQATVRPRPLILVGLLILFVYGLGEARTPLLFSAILAYLTFPLVKWLQRRGIARPIGSVLIFLVVVLPFILLIAFLLPIAAQEVSAFIQSLPDKSLLVMTKATEVAQSWGLPTPYRVDQLEKVIHTEFKDFTLNMLTSVMVMLKASFLSLPSVMSAVMSVLLVPVFYLYITNDYERWRAKLKSIVPEKIKVPLHDFSEKTEHIMGGYVRGQLICCAVMGFLYSLGLAAIGLPFGWLIGLLTGFFVFVPYIGFSVGFLIAMVVALTQDGGQLLLLTPLVMFSILTFENLVITPRLVGKSVGLSAMEAILALIVAGHLFGVLGVLFAIPLGAFTKELLILLATPPASDQNVSL